MNDTHTPSPGWVGAIRRFLSSLLLAVLALALCWLHFGSTLDGCVSGRLVLPLAQVFVLLSADSVDL